MHSDIIEMLQEVSEDYVKLWLKMMNEGTLLKDVYQYVALMSSFCVNKGVAVRDAQDSIRGILLHANMVLPKLSVSSSGQLLITTRFEDITKQNFAFKNWEIRTMPLAQFVEAHEADSNVMHDVDSNANYLENVLTLLAAVSQLLFRIDLIAWGCCQPVSCFLHTHVLVMQRPQHRLTARSAHLCHCTCHSRGPA